MVLKSRHSTAVAKKMNRGQRDTNIGLGTSGCSYIGLKIAEST